MKDELVVLGTGNALAKELYNTCFALRGTILFKSTKESENC